MCKMKTERERDAPGWRADREETILQTTNKSRSIKGQLHVVWELCSCTRPCIDKVPNMDPCYAVTIRQFLMTSEPGTCFSLHGRPFKLHSQFWVQVSHQLPVSRIQNFSSRSERSSLNWINSTFPDGSDGKESACNTEDPGSIPWLGRPPGEREW